VLNITVRVPDFWGETRAGDGTIPRPSRAQLRARKRYTRAGLLKHRKVAVHGH